LFATVWWHHSNISVVLSAPCSSIFTRVVRSAEKKNRTPFPSVPSFPSLRVRPPLPYFFPSFYSYIECSHCQHHNSIPLENYSRSPGRPHTTWMKIIQQDMKPNNLSLDEAINVAQNRPFWRLVSAFVLHTPSGVPHKKKIDCFTISVAQIKIPQQKKFHIL